MTVAGKEISQINHDIGTFLLTGLNLTVTSLWVGTSVQKSFMFSLAMVGEDKV